MMSDVMPNTMPVVGIFQTDGDFIVNQPAISPIEQFSRNSDAGQSVLDYFIQPVAAGQVPEPEPEPMCSDNVTVGLTFNIPANPGPVDICLFGGINLMSTIDDADIADFGFKNYSFTNIVATESEVSGDFAFPLHGNENVLCSAQFSAPLVQGVFSCNEE